MKSNSMVRAVAWLWPLMLMWQYIYFIYILVYFIYILVYFIYILVYFIYILVYFIYILVYFIYILVYFIYILVYFIYILVYFIYILVYFIYILVYFIYILVYFIYIYLYPRLLYFHVSSYLSSERREIEADPNRPTHRWMVYVRGGKDERTNLNDFIKYVDYHLHESYAPDHIVRTCVLIPTIF